MIELELMDTLPAFPEFVKLSIDHKQILRNIVEAFPPYSDFNFVSLFTWDTDGDIALSSLNDNLVIRFSGYTDDDNFLSLLGNNKILETIDVLLEECEKLGLQPELKLIGESVIDAIPLNHRNKYHIEEDRDNHDYILSATNMSEISNFHPKKRTKYNHFMNNHGEHAVCKELDLTSKKIQTDIEQLLKEWQHLRNKNDEDVRKEFEAIDRCLKHASDLNMLGYGTYVKDKLIAFTLFEVVHNKTAMLHFGKTHTEHIGANEHLQHRLAQYIASLGIELMNNEQDLGIEGLRKSKEASMPVNFLKKYTIRPVS